MYAYLQALYRCVVLCVHVINAARHLVCRYIHTTYGIRGKRIRYAQNKFLSLRVALLTGVA